MDQDELIKLIEDHFSKMEGLNTKNLGDNLQRSYIIDDLVKAINLGFESYVSQADFDLGYEEGRDDGYESGYEVGYEEGFEAGKDDED